MPSVGSGRVANNWAVLIRENLTTDPAGACTYHRRDVAELFLFGPDRFQLQVTEEQSAFAAQCPSIPAGGHCLSFWTWTLEKAP